MRLALAGRGTIVDRPPPCSALRPLARLLGRGRRRSARAAGALLRRRSRWRGGRRLDRRERAAWGVPSAGVMAGVLAGVSVVGRLRRREDGRLAPARASAPARRSRRGRGRWPSASSRRAGRRGVLRGGDGAEDGGEHRGSCQRDHEDAAGHGQWGGVEGVACTERAAGKGQRSPLALTRSASEGCILSPARRYHRDRRDLTRSVERTRGSGGGSGIIGRVQLRRATPDDADDLAETSRQGFESYREWAPATYDPPPAGLEAGRIREGLQRPDTWGADRARRGGGGRPRAARAGATSARSPVRRSPASPTCGCSSSAAAGGGAGLAAELNRRVVEEAAAPRLRPDAAVHAGGPGPGARVLRARGVADRRRARCPSRCWASTWSIPARAVAARAPSPLPARIEGRCSAAGRPMPPR